MSNTKKIKTTISMAALNLLPPLLRETLIQDTKFQDEYDFITDAEISYDEINVSFQRSKFYYRVRSLLSKSITEQVADNKGDIWGLRNTCEEGSLPNLLLTKDDQVINISNLTILSPDSKIRLSYFQKLAKEANLPINDEYKWNEILRKRPLSDDEVNLFHNDIDNTPAKQAQLVRHVFQKNRHISISSFVPKSRKYYDRLIGAYDGSATIYEYASTQGKKFFEQLINWSPYEGFLHSLLLSSHSSLTEEIIIDQLSDEELVNAFEYIDKYGDSFSQLGAIEIGLRIVKSKNYIEPILIRLLEQVRSDDSEKSVVGFKLIYSLFVLIDGELSRNKLFILEPPFYRRLASLTHAALVYRVIITSSINIDQFCEWSLNIRGEHFYLQSLVDMYKEPRWYPELAESSQIGADFLGRIIITAYKYQSNITDKLYELILSETKESIYSNISFSSFYPGPLEGKIDDMKNLPDVLSKSIEKQLNTNELTPESFITLINSVLVFNIAKDQAELAINSLKLSSYQLKQIEDKSQLLVILNGLAMVAAVSRSTSLAEDLKVLVRKYKKNYLFTIDEQIRICLIAGGSHSELSNWVDFVGNWLTELAFSNLEDDDGKIFYSRLSLLCKLTPELWITCGKAHAALIAYNER
ncbi:hypothetical protein [Robertmurraya korlensis]|uniref:hypothetical protein n=1 Tax=Robertmurraya korlensis TaxID=519977 RepID=UPI000825C840|nr:hypothetical protein [Robertmurraya korlensis]